MLFLKHHLQDANLHGSGLAIARSTNPRLRKGLVATSQEKVCKMMQEDETHRSITVPTHQKGQKGPIWENKLQ